MITPPSAAPAMVTLIANPRVSENQLAATTWDGTTVELAAPPPISTNAPIIGKNEWVRLAQAITATASSAPIDITMRASNRSISHPMTGAPRPNINRYTVGTHDTRAWLHPYCLINGVRNTGSGLMVPPSVKNMTMKSVASTSHCRRLLTLPIFAVAGATVAADCGAMLGT